MLRLRSMVVVGMVSLLALVACQGDSPTGSGGSGSKNTRGTFTDPRDNKTYKTTVIGGKTWMAENLNIFNHDSSWCYGGDWSNCDIYGRLYSWDAALEACPPGWRLPTEQDWENLEAAVIDWVYRVYPDTDNLNSDIANSLRAKTWMDGDDTFGFSALPGGYRDAGTPSFGAPCDRNFCFIGYDGYWWTATTAPTDTARAWMRRIDPGWFPNYSRWHALKRDGYSVRCIKN